MATVSSYAGSVGTANATAGSTTWTNTSNAVGSPTASYASSSSGLGSGGETQSLDLYNFNPGVPSGSTITGCQITIQALYTEPIGSSAPAIDGCQLELNGVTGTPTTTTAVGTSLTKTAATYTFGSSTDLWGIASGNWTVSNVNSAVENTGPTFSVWINMVSTAHPATPEINGVQITITYTAGGGGSGATGGIGPGFARSVLTPQFSNVSLFLPGCPT